MDFRQAANPLNSGLKSSPVSLSPPNFAPGNSPSALCVVLGEGARTIVQPHPSDQGSVLNGDYWQGGGHEEQHSFDVRGCTFIVPKGYSLSRPIGRGAYGVVVSATSPKGPVAIKKINNAFSNTTDTRRTLREIRLLRHLSMQKHENILGIVDILRPSSKANFQDVYLVSELMDTDLNQIIQSPQGLTSEHHRYFLFQLLRGLKFIHSANIIHRDLKPSNLLINKNCDLKICDFGLARAMSSSESVVDNFMTEYVATRWYRAPEVILSWRDYTTAVDMWAVGCIFAEMLSRKALFPGKDFLHQINMIVATLGKPSPADLEGISSEKAYYYVMSRPHADHISWNTVIPNGDPLAIDLLDRMLQFNPQKRISVEDALNHPFLETLHCLEDEPLCSQLVSFESIDDVPLSRESLRDALFIEMAYFHPQARGEINLRAPCQPFDEPTSAAEPVEVKDIVNALASQLVLEPNTTDINGLLADLGRDNPFLSASQLDQLAALAHQQARAIIGQNTQQSQQFLAMQPPQSHFLPNISPLVSSPADSNLSSFHLQCHQQCVPEGGLSRSVSNLQYPQDSSIMPPFPMYRCNSS